MVSLEAEHLTAFLSSLAIGLLIGVERERAGSELGLRSTALSALLGTLSALVGQGAATAWFLPTALLALTAAATLRPSTNTAGEEERHSGYTSRMALLLAFTLGAAVWLGYRQHAVMLAIVTASMLHFKAQLRGFSARITSRDVVSVLQFAALSFVIFPLLPNSGYGPYRAINPHHVWLMVILVSGLSLLGYAVLRACSTRLGPPLLGILGGLVSSTATTLVYARQTRARPAMTNTAAFVILTANLVVAVRLGALSLMAAPTLFAALWPVLAGNVLAGGMVWALGWRLLRQQQAPNAGPELTNPTNLRVALTFGLVYAAVLLLTAWLADWAGTRGLYVAAVASGLTELDAIALSTMRLFVTGRLEASVATNAIALAIVSNLLFKTSLLAWIGGRDLLQRSVPGVFAIAIGIALGVLGGRLV